MKKERYTPDKYLEDSYTTPAKRPYVELDRIEGTQTVVWFGVLLLLLCFNALFAFFQLFRVAYISRCGEWLKKFSFGRKYLTF